MAAAKIAWKALALTSGLAAATVTRTALNKSWKRATGDQPPRNPAAPGTNWKQALAWAAASGTALGVAKVVATQGAAKAWTRTTGSLPPGLEEVGA